MTTALPASLTDLLGSPNLNGRAVLMVQATDLDLEGHAAEQWLVVTETEIAIIEPPAWDAPAHQPHVRIIPLRDITGIRIAAEVGSGYFQVEHGGVWNDVLRFSNRLASEFQALVPKLELLRNHHEFILEEPDVASRHCVDCGTPIGEGKIRCGKCQPVRRSVWRAMGLLRPYLWQVAAMGALSLGTIALELVPPWLQKDLVDRVLAGGIATPNQDILLATLLTIVSILAGVRLTTAIVAVLKARLASTVGASLTADLRCQMVRKLQKASLPYHDRNQVGLLMSRVAYDTEAMHAFMHHLTGGFVLQMVQMLAIGGMLFSLNAKLALYALLPSPLVLLSTWIFCRYFYAQQNRYWDAVGRQAVSLTNLLTGIRVVKSFTQEDRENARFAVASTQLRDQRIQVDLATSTFSSLVGFLFAVGGLLVWYVGGREVLQQQMSLGALMAFLSYLVMFYAPLTSVSEAASWISSFFAASERIFDLLDTPDASDETATAPRNGEPVHGKIEFDHVSFSYDGRVPVLEDMSFQIQPGQIVGIVGRSGSGKSTIAGLISRLYEVDSGTVRIDGIDVRSISPTELRRQVGIVLQEPFLFEGTVAANIAYGDPHAEPERIIDSAKAAAAHDFILRLPFGYDTPLGERGAGLSGGERQRVSIARAILYNPRILILDEATSSIDSESEHLIQCAMERFAQGRTTLAIAHRLSTLERADHILVIDRGRLMEQGTHTELKVADGLYAKFVRLQFGQHPLERDDDRINGHGPSSTERTFMEPDFTTLWLRPDTVQVEGAPNGRLGLQVAGRQFSGVSVVRAFPATRGEQYLSLRYLNPEGRDVEIGLIQTLSEWPARVQELIRRALNRRYLLRIVHRFQSLRENHSLLECVAETDDGVVMFSVQNSPQSIKSVGDGGCLLTDVTNNHFLVPSMHELTTLQQQLLLSPVPTL